MKKKLTKEEIIEQFKNGRVVLDASSIKILEEYFKEQGILILNPDNPEHQSIILEDQIRREEERAEILAETNIQDFDLGDFEDYSDYYLDPNEEIIDVQGFLTEFDKFLINEKNIEREENKQKERLSVRERVIKGYIVPNLRFVESKGNLYTFKVKYNFSKFRRGSHIVLRIFDGDEMSGPSIRCKYWSETKDTVVLKIDTVSDISKSKRYIIFDESEFSILNIRRALQFASQSKDLHNRLERILFHDDLKGIQRNLSVNSNEIPYNFCDSQKIAFVNAIESDCLHLIQGPPGTGKTSLLASIAIYFAKRGKKVLITGFTHSSINNALNRVNSFDHNIAIAKLGRVERDDDTLNEDIQCLSIGMAAHKRFIAQSGWIAGATVFEAAKMCYRSAGIDITIVDEASQLNSAFAVCALSFAPKTIMIGDQMQLPPIIKGNYDKPYLDRSLFEYLFKKYSGSVLSETYRMSDTLCRFPSSKFYNSKLVPSTSMRNKSVQTSIFGVDAPIVWISYSQKGKSRIRSKKEALLLKEVIEELMQQNVDPTDIGVVTPFRAHIRYIFKELGYNTEIEVDTVEKYQGREKEIIIFSLVSNDTNFIQEISDFYFDIRRFNVAITRATRKVIVIADSGFVDFNLDYYGFSLIREYILSGTKVLR